METYNSNSLIADLPVETEAPIKKQRKPRSPLKRTAVRKKQFLAELSNNGFDIASACKTVGVTRTAFYNYKYEDPEFAQALDDIQEALLDKCEAKLQEFIDDDNLQALLFYLKTKGKSRGYSEKSEIDVNANVNVQILNIDPITD